MKEGLPPHNTEAEQALLGRLLSDSQSAWPLIGPRLKPDHFYEPVHARIFDAIAKLAGTGKIASPVTLHNAFEGDTTLAEIGGRNIWPNWPQTPPRWFRPGITPT